MRVGSRSWKSQIPVYYYGTRRDWDKTLSADISLGKATLMAAHAMKQNLGLGAIEGEFIRYDEKVEIGYLVRNLVCWKEIFQLINAKINPDLHENEICVYEGDYSFSIMISNDNSR